MLRPKPRMVWFVDPIHPTKVIGRLDGKGHPALFDMAIFIRAMAKRGAPA